MHNTESRGVIGPEYVPYAGASVCLLGLDILEAGAVRG